ncbi:hypothetical protein A2U01_0092341, partial [Trifolium medium]|nr:hypothetical protein [Trifolium medium]
MIAGRNSCLGHGGAGANAIALALSK